MLKRKAKQNVEFWRFLGFGLLSMSNFVPAVLTSGGRGAILLPRLFRTMEHTCIPDDTPWNDMQYRYLFLFEVEINVSCTVCFRYTFHGLVNNKMNWVSVFFSAVGSSWYRAAQRPHTLQCDTTPPCWHVGAISETSALVEMTMFTWQGGGASGVVATCW